MAPMSRAWVAGLWSMCVAVGGCFEEPDPVGDGTQGADSGTTDAANATTSGTDGDDPGSTSAPGDSTGPGDTTDGRTTGSATTGQTDSGGLEGELLFDFYEDGCGPAVIRAGYTDPEGGMAIECGNKTPVGFINAAPELPTATGPASRVIAMGLAPAPGSSVGIETAMAVPIEDYQAAAFLAELDCGDMSTGTYEWFVSLPEPMGDTVPPVASGLFECGGDREILEVMLPVTENRAVAFAVRTEDAGMRLAALIDPIVVGLL